MKRKEAFLPSENIETLEPWERRGEKMENIEGRKEKSVARESLSLSCGFTTVDGSISPGERREGSGSRGGARRLIVRVLSNCGFRPVETRIEAICPFVAVHSGFHSVERRDGEERRRWEKGGSSRERWRSTRVHACAHRDNRLRLHAHASTAERRLRLIEFAFTNSSNSSLRYYFEQLPIVPISPSSGKYFLFFKWFYENLRG